MNTIVLNIAYDVKKIYLPIEGEAGTQRAQSLPDCDYEGWMGVSIHQATRIPMKIGTKVSLLFYKRAAYLLVLRLSRLFKFGRVMNIESGGFKSIENAYYFLKLWFIYLQV